MRYRYLYYILLLIPAFLFRDYTPTNELKYISREQIAEALKAEGYQLIENENDEPEYDAPSIWGCAL